MARTHEQKLTILTHTHSHAKEMGISRLYSEWLVYKVLYLQDEIDCSQIRVA